MEGEVSFAFFHALASQQPRIGGRGFEIIVRAVDIAEMGGEIVGVGIIERGDVDRVENAGLFVATMREGANAAGAAEFIVDEGPGFAWRGPLIFGQRLLPPRAVGTDRVSRRRARRGISGNRNNCSGSSSRSRDRCPPHIGRRRNGSWRCGFRPCLHSLSRIVFARRVGSTRQLWRARRVVHSIANGAPR